MTQEQQGDVTLYQTDDGGDITVESGIVSMSGGLETAAYLSLFGGNEDDAGGDDTRRTWWGNLSETEKPKQYRSETQNLLRSIPATSGNLLRVQAAAQRDLAWMIKVGAASSVDAVARIVGLNRIQLDIAIVADGNESKFVFSENWKSSV